ncbi:hypothetical protein ACW9YQ_07750 [Paraburkholderia strydomiana]
MTISFSKKGRLIVRLVQRSIFDPLRPFVPVLLEWQLPTDSVEKVVLWLGAQKLATRFRVVALSELANLNQAAIPVAGHVAA